MNFDSTDDFYKQLKNDYRDRADSDRDIETARKWDGIDDDAADIDKKVRQSFLYKYFKEKKDSDAKKISRDKDLLFEYRKPKMDKYTLLCGAYEAYKKGVISDEDYKEIFLEANASAKSGQKKRADRFDKDPDKAREELEDRLLRDCAESFIDNTSRRKSGSNIDVIEMLYKYIKMSHTNEDDSTYFAGSARAELSEEYIEKCANLYKLILSKEKMKEIFVPLFIDKNSGAGVYIIGEFFLDEDAPKVCVLSFEDIMKDEELNTSITLMMNCEKCNSIEEAFNRLDKEISNGDHIEGYRFRNQDFPNGADECFKSLFNDFVQEYVDQENKMIKEMKERGSSSVL